MGLSRLSTIRSRFNNRVEMRRPNMKSLPIAAWLALLIMSPARAYDPLTVAKGVAATTPQDFTVEDAERQREIPIRVYLPLQKQAAPVVLVSHGLGGTRAGSSF